MATEPSDPRRLKRLAQDLLAHEGWKEVLCPYFEKAKQKQIATFLHARTYEEFVGCQQAYCALDSLQRYILMTAEYPVQDSARE